MGSSELLFRTKCDLRKTGPFQRQPSTAFSELVLGEQKYIMELEEIVNKYIPETKKHFSECSKLLPENLKSIKAEHIFGNIKDIYEWHSNEFFTILKRCLKEPRKFGTKMEKNEDKMLTLYVEFFKNKKISDHIVSLLEGYFKQVSNKLATEFQIQQLLLLPINRIFKYSILFSAVRKDTPEFEKELTTAIEVMERITADLNDLALLWRLIKFPENIDDQGKLICHDPLFFDGEYKAPVWTWRLSRVGPRRLQVFLLEESIIFANIYGEENENLFEYQFQVKVSQIKTVEKENDKIRLNFERKNKDDINGSKFYIYSNEEETTIKWFDAIRSAMANKEKFLDEILEPLEN